MTGAQQLKELIKEVSGDKDISFSSCGANCFELNSPSSMLSHYVKVDSNFSSPTQNGIALSLPSYENISKSTIRKWLIGHELHPYTSHSYSINSLRPSQQMAIDNFIEALDKGYNSFLYISPTSTGKSSVLTKNLIKKLSIDSAKKISFIAVDKIKLVDQLNSEIESEVQNLNFNLQQIHWKAKELQNFSDKISQALLSDKTTAISISLRSFRTQMEKLKLENELLYNKLVKNIDGIWIDEVHHLGAPETLKFISKLKEKSGAFLYGTTATPAHKDVEIQKLFEKRHWSYLEDKQIESYPPSVVIEQLVSSIEKGDITPFNDIYVLLSEKLGIKGTPFFIQKEVNSLFSINPFYYRYLSKVLSVIFHSNKKGMIIVSTIREAEELSAFLNKNVKGISFESYHSGKTLEEREAVFENSRREEGSHYIVAVRALDEGVNLPHLSAYIDLNPQISVKQVVHRIGRVLRPYLNKLKADIFILSSYKDATQIKELMDGVEQIRLAKAETEVSNKKVVSIERKHLSNLSDQSFNFFLKQEKFWAKKSFPPFETAMKIAQKAGITTFKEYNAKYKALGLPSSPSITYKDDWQGFRHFLGTKFPSYETARQIIQQAGDITTQKDYNAKYKALGLPANPHITYKDDWQGLGHFLGTGRTRNKDFPPFETAMKIAQKAGITTIKDYNAKYKALGLPARPNITYKDDWQGFRHFLGPKFPSYETARQIIQQAGDITTTKDYNAKFKALGLPSRPHIIYKDDWQGFRHFLGTKFPSYETARQIIQQAGDITTTKDYNAKFKALGLPSRPHIIYKDDWQGFRHFLGTKFPSYETARQIIQQAGDITTTKDYNAKFKALGLPSRPHIIYKDDWQGFRHFLGTKFPSYETARQIIQQAGDITTQKDYNAKFKALGLPSRPNITYKDDWQGLGHFLGTGRTRNKDFPPFETAMKRAQKAGITTQKEYKAKHKALGLPSNPNITYKDDWQGFGHFLGTGRTYNYNIKNLIL